MRFSYADALRVGEILAQAAQTQIMPRFRTIAGEQIREKSSAFDVVTDADEAAWRTITAALKELFPEALIVGEEAAAKDPASLAKIATADLSFIVDPIDGPLLRRSPSIALSTGRLPEATLASQRQKTRSDRACLDQPKSYSPTINSQWLLGQHVTEHAR